MSINLIEHFPYILNGFIYNLTVTSICIVFGFVLGFFISALQFIYKDKFAGKIASVLVSLICGTPMIVQLMIYCYGLSRFIPLSQMVFAIIGISINSACYFSLIFLDAMCAIDDTYFLNLYGVNISKSMCVKKFLLPMIIKNSYNKITFEFISLLKETAILNVVGISEVFSRSKEIAWNFNAYVQCMLLCGSMFYLVFFIYKRWLHSPFNKMLVSILKFTLQII